MAAGKEGWDMGGVVRAARAVDKLSLQK